MKHTITFLLFATLVPGITAAQEADNYQCTMGELTRRVEIVSEPGVSVPCEVHYYKDSEAPGEHQVLWRALQEEGYCEAKASEFIVTLGEMGWDCGAAAASQMQEQQPEEQQPEEQMGSDDTADLAPAETMEATDPR